MTRDEDLIQGYAEALFSVARAEGVLPTVEDARRAFDGWGWDSPHGPVDLRRGAARHPVHLAVARGVELRVIARVR